MPTIGWVHEDAIEKFWEGQPRTVPEPKPVFLCKHCDRELHSSEELRLHYSLEHPIQIPALYIHGKPLLRESVLRAPVKTSDVELVQCTRCEVQSDGGDVRQFSVPDFRKRFIEPVNSTWNVRLVHERSIDQSYTDEEYHIRFRIPEISLLNAVDEHFIRTLVIEELKHSDLNQYDAGLPSEAPAREYGLALGDYALGIILKERRNQPYAPVGFEEFAIKMRSALEVLRFFNRPVALAVSGSIRFNLNDFHDYGTTTAPKLEAGLRFFRGITGEVIDSDSISLFVSETTTSAINAVCPVDRISDRLLAACMKLLCENNLPLSELEALRQLTRGMTPISEQDLIKIHVICAEGYLRINHTTNALQHLHSVQFEPKLKDWAQRQMEGIASHE